MRLFITSYQKSGTHQIMPMFVVRPDVVDCGHSNWVDVPERYGLNREVNWEGVEETVQNLRVFPLSSDRAFGHLAYMPEYAQVFEETDTKVLFNVRDPRDVIVAEYENAMLKMAAGDNSPLWNFYDKEAKKRIFQKEDPLTDLIILAAARWPRWLGWLDHDFVKMVKYEDLRLKTLETATEIYEWLQPFGIPIPEELVKKALPKPKNLTFRKGNVGDWKTTFKLHHMELAKELLEDTMNRMGYKW